MHQYPKGWHKENKKVASKRNSYAINPTKYSILCRQVQRRTKKTLGFLLKFQRFILQKVNILQSWLLAVGCTSLWLSRQRSATFSLLAHKLPVIIAQCQAVKSQQHTVDAID